ncbi:MAG: hypothetical protein KatS3mg035_1739 [Bacteroidia bacterium]|nr:MAG: hypothetical protein KatS3mg035_1739 [Bacteroidia bacterium]
MILMVQKNFYVILLDNGKNKIYWQKKKKRDALACIRCGACLNACPIYKNVGGHTYASTYSGPIGSVITPHLKQFEEYKHLSLFIITMWAMYRSLSS